MDITKLSPVEIDILLAEIYGRYFVLISKAHALCQQAQSTRSYRYGSEEQAAEYDAKADELYAQAKLVNEETLPFEAEFSRRGGWTRAFIVDNTDGHVHRTRSCSTCFPTTGFHWLVELSGQDETQIVELAGERACTVCYPTAPVDVLKRPSRLEGPLQAAAREAAAQRKLEKAARDVAKAAKAITNPDGTPLRGEYGTINTIVSAWRELIDSVYSHRHYGYQLHSCNPRIVTALAVRLDRTEDDIRAEVETKVAAKAKREGR